MTALPPTDGGANTLVDNRSTEDLVNWLSREPLSMRSTRL